MSNDLPQNTLELRSLVISDGTLELSLREALVPVPAANEVLVRVEASPINPSDLGVLIAGADMSAATVAGTPERPTVTAPMGPATLLYSTTAVAPASCALRDLIAKVQPPRRTSATKPARLPAGKAEQASVVLAAVPVRFIEAEPESGAGAASPVK